MRQNGQPRTKPPAMLISRILTRAVAAVTLAVLLWPPVSATDKPPSIAAFSKPLAGSMEILFRGTAGPFMVQTRAALDSSSPWVDVPGAIITEVQPGVLSGLIPAPPGDVDLNFYRVVSEGDPTTEISAWTVLLRVSSPTNGLYFVQGESPVVTVTILDTMGGGLSRADFSTLNLYMDGPQAPLQNVTAAKLLNASTVRTNSIHHYVNLAKNADVQV